MLIKEKVKLFPLRALNEIEKVNNGIYPILFYGNEIGLISSLIKSIHNLLQKKLGSCDIKYFDYKAEKNEEFINTPSPTKASSSTL